MLHLEDSISNCIGYWQPSKPTLFKTKVLTFLGAASKAVWLRLPSLLLCSATGRYYIQSWVFPRQSSYCVSILNNFAGPTWLQRV